MEVKREREIKRLLKNVFKELLPSIKYNIIKSRIEELFNFSSYPKSKY